MSTENRLLSSLENERHARFIRRFRRNRKAMIGLTIVVVLVVVAIFAPLLAPYSISETNIPERTQPPSLEHPFGTDSLGRDVLSRVIMGTRISLYVGFAPILIAFIAGTTIGVVAGFYGGRTDEILMRGMDAMMSFPAILLALTVVAVIGPELNNVILALAFVYTPYIARVGRSAALSVSTEPFVEAAVARGERDSYIIFREVLPNCFAPLLVQASINVSFAILLAASLSFLGLGAQPPTPAWGLMINIGRGFIRQAPWILLFPGLALATTVIGFNMLGAGLRDVLDPKVDMIE